jgi:integrase
LAEVTLEDYRLTLRQFGAWLRENHPRAGPATIAEREMNGYLDARAKLVGEKCLQTQYRQLKGFLEWSGNPVCKRMALRWNAPPRLEVYWLEPEEADALVDANADPATALLIHLGLEMGLRRVDCARLTPESFNRRTMEVMVRGKGSMGGKWRTLPWHQRTGGLLDDWLMERADMARRRPAPDSLFVTRNLTAPCQYWYNKRMREAFGRAGILEEKSGYHTLRRTFGRAMYFALQSSPRLQRDPLDMVAELLGHSNRETTRLYIGLNSSHMREAMSYAPSWGAGSKTATPKPEIQQA